MVLPSASQPDWSRERPRGLWDPSRRLIKAIRDYQGASTGLSRRLAVVRHRFWSSVVSSELPLNAAIGGGLALPHPFAIVVHPDVTIGPNCLLMHGVTLGTNGPGGVPKVGGHVDIGPGAAVLGPVTIGDHAVIGANAVVLCDVPAGHVAIGAPARVRPLRDGVPPDPIRLPERAPDRWRPRAVPLGSRTLQRG